MAKATKAEIAQRIEVVVKLVINGYSYSDVVRYSAQNWGINRRQTDHYLTAAKDVIQANADRKNDRQFEIALHRLEDIYRRAVDAKRYLIALEAQKDINNLFGLYAPKKQDITLNVIRDFSDDELDANIQEIEAYLQGHADSQRASLPRKVRTGKKAKTK